MSQRRSKKSSTVPRAVVVDCHRKKMSSAILTLAPGAGDITPLCLENYSVCHSTEMVSTIVEIIKLFLLDSPVIASSKKILSVYRGNVVNCKEKQLLFTSSTFARGTEFFPPLKYHEHETQDCLKERQVQPLLAMESANSLLTERLRTICKMSMLCFPGDGFLQVLQSFVADSKTIKSLLHLLKVTYFTNNLRLITVRPTVKESKNSRIKVNIRTKKKGSDSQLAAIAKRDPTTKPAMKKKKKAPRRKFSAPPIQCYRCQAFNHYAWDCSATQRCLRCGGAHRVTLCDRPREAAPTCCNCGGQHAASYAGCPVNRCYRRKQKPSSQNQSHISTNLLAASTKPRAAWNLPVPSTTLPSASTRLGCSPYSMHSFDGFVGFDWNHQIYYSNELL